MKQAALRIAGLSPNVDVLKQNNFMRQLARTDVLKSAITLATISAVLCLPRLWFWPARKYPLWYLEALLLLGGTVLWAFVFAWHTKYTSRPVFSLSVPPATLALATIAAIATAVLLTMTLDPSLQTAAPEDYPKSFSQWLAITLFSLAFTQMFLVFAPFAWLMRLFKNQTIAVAFTIVFGLCVALLRDRSSLSPLPSDLLTKLLLARAVTSLLTLYFYLRAGVLLAWLFVLLTLSRHLFLLQAHR